MALLIKNLFGHRLGRAFNRQSTDEDGDHIIIEDPETPEKPFIQCSIYYLAVVLFVGLPMWFYTCSSTRYSLPNLQRLDNKLSDHPRLHLDISVVQLIASNSQVDKSKLVQSDYLRSFLPDHFETSIENVTYNIDWRIRRPTIQESQLVKTLMKEHESSQSNLSRQEILSKLESSLASLHKSSNRFRLFMFLFDEPLNSLVCDQPQSYLISFERFVYLCPGEGNESLLNLIQSVLHETYYNTVDKSRLAKILNGKTDLLFTFVPENQYSTIVDLAPIAKKVHQIYEKNVKNRYFELAEVLSVRLITQYISDFLSGGKLDKLLIKPAKTTHEANLTEKIAVPADRRIDINRMGELFHNFESRLSKHSAQYVQYVLAIVPDGKQPHLTFNGDKQSSGVSLIEERDSNFIFVGDSEKSLVLGLRAIIRRIIGLNSYNLCKNCLVRRHAFINSWELDTIVGALTILKLHSVRISLTSISQQAIGIKIPKHVASMAHEANDLALKAIDNLEMKKPLEAYRSINAAFELSETAFYDPSLLETLYFPDETKYAIYLPLFLPLAFPFLMSVLRIFRYLTSSPIVDEQKKRQ